MIAENCFTEEQKLALEIMGSGGSMFLTGKAGTGKSTVLRHFRTHAQNNIVFLAPTGIAARNIEGQTCHSFFKLPTGGIAAPDNMKTLSRKQRKILKRTDVIVIDEISMLRSDYFYAIHHRLQEVMDSELPFGGKQMVFCGDFCQLPPVVKEINGLDCYGTLTAQFGGIFSFQTNLWKAMRIPVVMLTRIMRQQDSWLIKKLNEIRYGCPQNSHSWLAEVNSALCRPAPAGDSMIQLCARNKEAELLNQTMLQTIPGEPYCSKAWIKNHFPWSEYPTDENLHIKPNMRVMLLRNGVGTDESGYVNGDLGAIVAILMSEVNAAMIEAVKVRLDRGGLITVGRVEWEHCEYVQVEAEDAAGKKKLELRKVGSFYQLPLKAAYAISIHKSQGMTFEKVAIDFGYGCFASGQLSIVAKIETVKTQGLRMDIAKDKFLSIRVLTRFWLLQEPTKDQVFNV